MKKFTSTQWFGLAVVLVFGARLAFTLFDRKDPDVLPSGVRISDLPKVNVPAMDPFAPLAEPLKAGSQEARDMLYCAGVLTAEGAAKPNAPMEESLPRLSGSLALGNAGRTRLEAEHAVQGFGAMSVQSAWTEKAAADHKAGTLAIPVADCLAKAKALPPPPPDPNAPPEKDLTLEGSQPARDDLYCAGVISAEFDHNKDQEPDQMSKQIDAMRALDQAGLAKLVAEGIAEKEFGATYSLPHVARANADYEAGKLRIPFTACMARAATVPPAAN